MTDILVGIIGCKRMLGMIGLVAITFTEQIIVKGDILVEVFPYILVVSLYVLQLASKENQGPKIPIKTKLKPIKAPIEFTILALLISNIHFFPFLITLLFLFIYSRNKKNEKK